MIFSASATSWTVLRDTRAATGAWPRARAVRVCPSVAAGPQCKKKLDTFDTFQVTGIFDDLPGPTPLSRQWSRLVTRTP